MPDSMKQPRGEDGQWVSLRDHIERIFAEHRTAHDQRHAADQEAIRQAREVIDSRLEKLNELRSEVLTDRQGYLTKQQFEAIRKEMNSEQGRATEVLAGKVDRIAGDLSAYIENQRKLQEQRAKEERSRRQALTWTLISLAVSIAGLAIAFFAR